MTFQGTEEHVCATTLRAERAKPQAQQLVKSFLELIPKSHKRYAITIKLNQTNMLHFLQVDNYYHGLMQTLLQKLPYFRYAIWTQELDTRGVKHIHGIITASQHERYTYKQINAYFPGHNIRMTKLFFRDKTKLKERRYDNTVIPISTDDPDGLPFYKKSPHPDTWTKYILKYIKVSKEIYITAFKNAKLKQWLKDMTICHIENPTEKDEDLDRAVEAAAIFRQLPKL